MFMLFRVHKSCASTTHSYKASFLPLSQWHHARLPMVEWVWVCRGTRKGEWHFLCATECLRLPLLRNWRSKEISCWSSSSSSTRRRGKVWVWSDVGISGRGVSGWREEQAATGGRGQRRGESPVLLHHLDSQVVELTGQAGCQLSQHFLQIKHTSCSIQWTSPIYIIWTTEILAYFG